ncbi:hypothetical protein [Saccharopolyspora sp. ASAGF58]|nr:hypothetical protein [Saccharopolyspora sp. ASAGF58]
MPEGVPAWLWHVGQAMRTGADPDAGQELARVGVWTAPGFVET